MFRHISLAALALALTTGTSSAWVTPSSTNLMTRTSTTRNAPSFRSTDRLHASTIEASAKTDEDAATLSAPFAAATEMALGKLKASVPEQYMDTMLPLLSHFVKEYMSATEAALEAGGDPEICAPEAAAKRILTGIGYGFEFGIKNKYKFDVSHEAIRGDNNPDNVEGIPPGVDFYAFGCDFFRPVMDLEKSVILGQDNLKIAIEEQLAKGENVVLLANHQSEADPQVVSCCLEKAGYGKAAADMVYVAGHKVTTDPLAIPFSMGRNLICIHSKKHIDADPETKPAKQRQNLKSMNHLLTKFKEGGCLLWVAPSGGRDRRNVETGEVPIAPFDSKTIDIFRLMGNKSKVKTHYYTLAMVSYDLCPPPDFVEAGVGEERNVRFVPVGIAMGDEVESVGGLEGRKEFCKHAMEQCDADYKKLLAEISKQ